MREGFRLYLRLMSAQIRSQMQYKMSFLMEFASTFMGMILEFASVIVLFVHMPALDGWSLAEVAFLYGSAEFAMSLAQVLTSGFDVFPETVRLGKFDSILIRPRNAMFQVFASELAIRRFGRAMQGVLVLGVAIWWMGVDWGVAEWSVLAMMILGGMVFFTGLFIIGATFSFWTVEGLEAMNILTYGGVTMAAYPMSIYAEWMRNVFIFIIPLAFVNYYPSLFLLKKADPFGLPEFMPFLSFPLCSLVLLASLVFWHVGIKRYQSTGH